ncbi:hypothetical protein BDR07DRAFT_1374355 [Suillus spraguei]|nr:hypothetical protein BDR07DRAFT_1374355 [Suillus spraguei]
MPSPFHLLEGLGKVIALRFKRPKTQGRTQHDLTTADHEGNSSIPTDISNSVPTPMHPSISLPVHPVSTGSSPSFEEFSTGFPSTAHAFGASPAREASDFAQLALPLVQAFTGVIPLVGAPINAAIGGLLAILQAIDDYHRDAIRTGRP